MDDRFGEELLSGDKGKSLSQVKTNLATKKTLSARPRAVCFDDTVFEDVTKERFVGVRHELAALSQESTLAPTN